MLVNPIKELVNLGQDSYGMHVRMVLIWLLPYGVPCESGGDRSRYLGFLFAPARTLRSVLTSKLVYDSAIRANHLDSAPAQYKLSSS